MGKKIIRAFTLLEIVFVIVIVSIGFMSLLYAISYAFDNVQSTKQRVIAINLAREGIEGVYQIRDTNRLSSPSKKDQCRLDMNPILDQGNVGCEDDSWMGSGNYILQKIISGNQQTFYLSGGDLARLDLSDGLNYDDSQFSLCLSGGLRESCPGNVGNVTYFRQIRGEGLFYKNTNTTGGDYLNCSNGDATSNPPNLYCGGIDAKEFRFCSKVAYIGQGKGEVELCGIITNFLK